MNRFASVSHNARCSRNGSVAARSDPERFRIQRVHDLLVEEVIANYAAECYGCYFEEHYDTPVSTTVSGG
jgi:hypothetical protein